MSGTIKKAVIPAGGLGTRMLPISRAVPKEMLPIVDKPVIAYLVEEAKASGAEDVLIITGRGKGAMEDYFDYSPEYERHLKKSGKESWIEPMRAAADGINVYFLRQKEAGGLGHAVRKAKSFTGNEPFYVLYGDDLIDSQTPVCLQLLRAYEKRGLATVGVQNVPDELVSKYCSMDASPIEGEDGMYHVKSMIEKPKPEEKFTNLAILGRVLLTPEIYDVLDETPLGTGGELQLTDAMKTIAEREGMTAVEFEGTRYDMGSKIGFLKANTAFALKNGDLAGEYREYLKSLGI